MSHRAHNAYKQQALDERTLLERHAPLIHGLARRIASRIGNPNLAEELWSAGAMGLLDAAQRFDAALGVRFETFAQHRIRGAMVDELRRIDHLPRRMRSEAARVAKARETLTREQGRPPADSEVAEHLGIDLTTLAETDGFAAAPMPLLPQVLKSLASETLENEVLRSEVKQRHAAAVATLPQRLQILLSLHYVEDLTYREIAEVLKVSQPRVSQLHADAIAKLRAAMEGEGA